ncbi:unnamed protein product [Urochloa humidicola]
MEQKAGEDEIAEKREKAAASGKKHRPAIDGASGAGFSDEVTGNILARLPTRAAVACTALSKRHRRLIRSPDFRSLHRRLAPPLPRPHIAYMTNAQARQRNWHGRVSDFHGFHVAGAGLTGGGGAPMRALAGGRYLKKQYINTCNGVVLLATGEKMLKSKRPTCVLWNPAVADDDKEVTVPYPWKGSYRILGLGYGPRSETYKLLLWRRWRLECEPPEKKYSTELLVYTLGTGGAQEQPRSLMVFPAGMSGSIIPESLYLDGTVYILHDCSPSAIIAFDVDYEKVTVIDIPGDRDPGWPWHARSKLMEMSGRLCVVTNHGHHRVAIWLLTADRRWEQRCVIGNEANIVSEEDEGNEANIVSEEDEGGVDRCFMNGVWDCGGVLAMYLDFRIGDYDKLCLYHVAEKKMFKADLPRDLTPDNEDFALCWGYKPTLVSPGSIIGELGQDEKRRDWTVDIMKPLKLANEKDKSKGYEETMDTMSFMEFMVRIIQKLPENMQDVLEMPMLTPGDSGFFFESASFSRMQHISDKLASGH